MSQCRDCKWYENSVNEEFGETFSRCRRYAPRMLHGSGTGWSDTKWPTVVITDWCGEFKEEQE